MARGVEEVLGSLDTAHANALRPFLRIDTSARPTDAQAVLALAFDPRPGAYCAPRWGAPHEVTPAVLDALATLDEPLARTGAAITTLVLTGDATAVKSLPRIAETKWFSEVRRLNLSRTAPTAAALGAVAARGSSIAHLDLDQVKVGTKLSKLSGMKALRGLSLRFSGVTEEVLTALVGADLPTLSELQLLGIGQYKTEKDLQREMPGGGFRPAVLTPDVLSPLLSNEHARRWTALTIGDAVMTDEGALAFAKAPLEHLAALWFKETSMSAVALMSVLGELPALTSLRRDGGFPEALLIAAPFTPRLTSLVLEGALDITDARVGALLGVATSLRELNLARASLGSALADALANTSAPLSEVRLTENTLEDRDVQKLCGSAWCRNATTLGLSGNPIGGVSVAALAAVPFEEVSLGLSKADLDDADVAPLWTAPFITRAPSLALAFNRLTDVTVARILSASLRDDVSLVIRDNCFSPTAAKQLAAVFGGRAPDVDRQLPSKALTPRPLRIAGGLQLASIGKASLQVQTPPVAGETVGAAFALDLSYRVFVGTSLEDGELVIFDDAAGKLVPRVLSQKIVVERGATIRHAQSSNGFLAVAISQDATYAIAREGQVTKLGPLEGSARAVASLDGRPCVVVLSGDGAASTVRCYVGRAEGGQHWAPQWTEDDALTFDGTFDSVVISDQAVAIFGPPLGEFGEVAFVGLCPDPDVRDGRLRLALLSRLSDYALGVGGVHDREQAWGVTLSGPILKRARRSTRA
jgi:hypothetical protein